MRTYKLHLIRHGMTDGNEQGQYVGRTDLKITTNGIIELEKLRDEGIYPKCDLVFSSPLSRAVDTAKIIFPEKEIIINKNFEEIDFGEFECKTPED
ncbi:MAG: histidine phosphatase family protein, partial [Clostridia bacterium]|nr:histidine phosphatase family protein [Clostridia bacterium]